MTDLPPIPSAPERPTLSAEDYLRIANAPVKHIELWAVSSALASIANELGIAVGQLGVGKTFEAGQRLTRVTELIKNVLVLVPAGPEDAVNSASQQAGVVYRDRNG